MTTPDQNRTSRLLCTDASSAALPQTVPAGERVLDGEPTAALLELAGPGGLAMGVWEMTPGAVRDTEAEEIFLVLRGRASVEFSDGEVLDVAAGSVVHLRSGDRTSWTVQEPLRKLYLQLR